MVKPCSALSVVVNAQADAQRYVGQIFRERALMLEISTGHHSQITQSKTVVHPYHSLSILGYNPQPIF